MAKEAAEAIPPEGQDEQIKLFTFCPSGETPTGSVFAPKEAGVTNQGAGAADPKPVRDFPISS